MLLAVLSALPAAEPQLLVACAAGTNIGNFDLRVLPPPGVQGDGIPLRIVNRLDAGQTVLYRPVPRDGVKLKGEIALVLVPLESKPSDSFAVLDPVDSRKPGQWTVPFPARIAAVVYGPRRLSSGKVRSLVKGDPALIAQLADYAERTTKAEQVLQALATPSRDSAAAMDAAVQGFVRSAYGPQLNPNAPAEQQYRTLIAALNPALSGYDPLATDSRQQFAQTASVAAVVAGLFFGPTVGMAASSAALLNNFRTLTFPNTEFRSAFAQPSPGNELVLCARRDPSRSRTKLAYIWAAKIPQETPPEFALAHGGHAPIAPRVTVDVQASDEAWRLLGRVTSWRLVHAESGEPAPVRVAARTDRRALDLELPPGLAPGSYVLGGSWDWTPMQAGTPLVLHPFPKLSAARVAPLSQAGLIARAGKLPLRLEGPDFQFLERIAWQRVGDRFSSPQTLPFLLPRGRQGGPQTTVDSEWDTSALPPGDYSILLTQSNGATEAVAAKILPPHPVIANLPLRLAPATSPQRLLLRGEQLHRIQALQAEGLDFQLAPPAPDSREREITVSAVRGLSAAARIPVWMQVADVPVPVPLGPAVQVASAKAQSVVIPSLPVDLSVELFEGELPAGTMVNFAIQTKLSGPLPAVKVRCSDRSTTLRPLDLRAGEAKPEGKLQLGASQLFLSLDPGLVGPVGCQLVAFLELGDGQTERLPLGRVVRLPVIESFELTDEQAGTGLYIGVLTGRDLDTIERTGWSHNLGWEVLGLPAPIAQDAVRQRLRVALRWPSPSPRAPVYLWLRGEDRGRLSRIRNNP